MTGRGMKEEAMSERPLTTDLDGETHALHPEDIRNTLCGRNVGGGTWSIGSGDVTCDDCARVLESQP